MFLFFNNFRLKEIYPELLKDKSVLVKGVDGGPDENPRYYNNMNMAIKSFQVRYHYWFSHLCRFLQELDLDCLIEVTEAPGLSAFNRAERRMFFLSKELGGVVLPHETYGSHLTNGKTTDQELELKNFQAAGGVLTDLWGKLVIDNHPVTAEYVSDPPQDTTKEFSVTPQYKSRHLIQTQYMTVVLKCDDLTCCSKARTDIKKFFPGRRLPALIPIQFTPNGPQHLKLEPEVWKKQLKFPDFFARSSLESSLVPDTLKQTFGDQIPYDAYFPTLQEKVINRSVVKSILLFLISYF